MKHRTLGFVAAGLLGASALLGCSKTVNADDLKAELKKNGMQAELADCVVNGLVAKNVNLADYAGTPSAENQKILTDVSTECVLKTTPAGGGG